MENEEEEIEMEIPLVKSEIEIIIQSLEEFMHSISVANADIEDQIAEAKFYNHPERIPYLIKESHKNSRMYSKAFDTEFKLEEWFGTEEEN